MRFFRLLFVQRLVALVVTAGVFAGVAEAGRARPAEHYAGWLRDQAKGEARALVDAALRQTVLPPAPTPGEFLSGYAAAQADVTAQPTGALFGYDDLTFMQALGRLEVRMAGLGAPPQQTAFAAAPAPLPAGAPATPALVLGRGAVAQPLRLSEGVAPLLPAGLPLRLLHGASAAQPMGP